MSNLFLVGFTPERASVYLTEPPLSEHEEGLLYDVFGSRIGLEQSSIQVARVALGFCLNTEYLPIHKIKVLPDTEATTPNLQAMLPGRHFERKQSPTLRRSS